ncbi:unnamed protein product [Cladocopium goreaui]|uniref:PPM-type phosphatase domain-containing protein n=1 Tax=Cladocopium goreaui TaxID=2562237 RepID=A0A9P1CRH3_9DINO|nr:unnamed protein product [Cladocopium goreaui]
MEMLESGELDLEDLEEEEAVDDDDMDDEEQAASSSAWANGQGPDGMGCTAVVALVRGGGKPEVPGQSLGRPVAFHGISRAISRANGFADGSRGAESWRRNSSKTGP